MRGMVLAFLMVLIGMLAATAGDAQDGWRINAGKGVGPLYLGMTEQDAIRVLGEPKKRITSPFHAFSYLDVELIFSNSGGVFTLFWIRLKGGSARTSEGIGRGSSLREVLRRYGDEVDNAQTGHESSRCPVVGLLSPKPSNYRAVVLSLDYKNRGIAFNFTSITEGASFTPRVADIIITHPSSCSG